MDNYALAEKSLPFPSHPPPIYYDGVKQLNRLNVNGVSMNPSPIYEMHVIISEKKKRVEKLSKYVFFFFFFFLCTWFRAKRECTD